MKNGNESINIIVLQHDLNNEMDTDITLGEVPTNEGIHISTFTTDLLHTVNTYILEK